MSTTTIGLLRTKSATAATLSANDLAALRAKITAASGDDTSRLTAENRTFVLRLDLAEIAALQAYIDNATALAGLSSIEMVNEAAEPGLATAVTALSDLSTAIASLQTAIDALPVIFRRVIADNVGTSSDRKKGGVLRRSLANALGLSTSFRKGRMLTRSIASTVGASTPAPSYTVV